MSGAAAWMWRLGVEGILGLRWRGGELLIDPCLPKAWRNVRVEIKGPMGTLAVVIEDPEQLGHGYVEMTVDGASIEGPAVTFPTDGTVREVRARLRRETSLGAQRAVQSQRSEVSVPSRP